MAVTIFPDIDKILLAAQGDFESVHCDKHSGLFPFVNCMFGGELLAKPEILFFYYVTGNIDSTYILVSVFQMLNKIGRILPLSRH